MRVLFVSHTFPLPGEPLSNVGGMQRLAVEQRAALESHPGVELTSLVLESSSRWTEARTVPFLARLLWQIPSIVRRRHIDVVLFSSMVTAATAPLLRRRLRGTGVRLAATPVGRDVTLPNRAYQRVVGRILGALDLVLPISRATAAECLARGLVEERLAIVPCGVDATRFPAVEARDSARTSLLRALAEAGEDPIPEGSLLLCSVGRHQERKGFHWFVEEVMPRLPGDVVFLLGGAGPMSPRIRQSVDRLGLRDRVRVLGRVSEETLLTLFRGSDLFVMPNVPVPGDIEGFGVVMLEAGLCGLPIVAADLEGIRDVVREGENGVLLPARNAAAFAEAIEGFRLDRAALRHASEEALRSTRARFAWDVVVEQYVEALSAGSPRRSSP
jgi:phosphatidylinositol alpha-1,6-mannosyltransferase